MARPDVFGFYVLLKLTQTAGNYEGQPVPGLTKWDFIAGVEDFFRDFIDTGQVPAQRWKRVNPKRGIEDALTRNFRTGMIARRSVARTYMGTGRNGLPALVQKIEYEYFDVEATPAPPVQGEYLSVVAGPLEIAPQE